MEGWDRKFVKHRKLNKDGFPANYQHQHILDNSIGNSWIFFKIFTASGTA